MHRPDLPPCETSGRRHLLASCAATALLVSLAAGPLLVLSGVAGGEARAADCTPQNNYACYYVVQPSPAPDNQSPAVSGTAVGAANVNIPGVTSPAGQAIVIGIIGGQGGTGHTYTGIDNSGVDGGRGGNGNILTVTTGSGITVGEITVIQADGGAGGSAGYSGHGGLLRTSGDGGTAGTVVAGTSGAPMLGQFNNPPHNSRFLPSIGLYVSASGGAGAQGVGQESESNNDGGNGGNGGNSTGGVSIVFGGSVSGTQGGIVALSQGGNGGNGGAAYGEIGDQGGDGGNGGTGGPVSVVLAPGGQVNPGTGSGAGITARSFGGQAGQGGLGGSDGSGGNAGQGAGAGNVTVVNNGSIASNSADSPGILAQSFGGAGGTGGGAGGWGAGGGSGGNGGNGGPITISGNGRIFTTGTNSPGIIAQSVGAGGGNGGNSNGWQAVGGDGAGAGNGGSITINNAQIIITQGERSSGVLAQSIGGGGGNGGDATSTALGPFNLVIGGSGAGGGNGAPIQAANSNIIWTSGLHAPGMLLQSIGGGGGNGGSAYSNTYSAVVGASVSIGGNGGGGGDGQSVGPVVNGMSSLPTNSNEIFTTGANSPGILGESIGGGGGNGGLSGATAKTYSVATADVPVPTISIAVAIGGTAGNGGGSNSVVLSNSGLIATAGGGSSGLAGQGIGGGGGSGGDASATASAKGGSSPVSIASSIAIGGRGGGGGGGGTVTLINSGLIVTRGEAADAVAALSAGGGGGTGGSGDAQARSSGDGANIATSLSLGAKNGGGGNGGIVTATNSGALLTLGDGATGILAQSIGGGGGRGGGVAGTSNGQFNASVSLGGSGGVGGSTWQGPTTNAVTVANTGTVVTFGADAPAIVAQSIGGGGGLGGKSASTLGNRTSTGDGGNGTGSSFDTAVTLLVGALGSGTLGQYNTLSSLIGIANSALGSVSTTGGLRDEDPGDALNALGSSAGNSGDGSTSTSIKVNVNVGGRGGAGGSAGAVQVTSTGSIGTVGAMSDGIMAQAIGGGGGRGGAAISSVTNNGVGAYDQTGQAPVSVGGNGGAGGNGATVAVENNGSIFTAGSMSSAIVAQSIAGGGGIAGVSAAKVQGSNPGDTSVLSLPIALGATGGDGGNAGSVTVINTGLISTQSHDAAGILAQSITGGGGLIRTLSTDAADNNGGGASAIGGDYGINLAFGGTSGSGTQSGSRDQAGSVTVTNSGTITTTGRDAYGILAQSIGGGGGLAQGGKPTGPNFFGTGLMRGDASAVAVNTTGNITTTGVGAVGIFAQSIGGGGGLAGDTGWTQQLLAFNQATNHEGNGGAITISVGAPGNSSALVQTSGDNAPALLLQSIGGGGGRISNKSGAFNGSAGGPGNGGAVTVDVYGTVQAAGHASPGIYAASEGQGGAGTPGSMVKIFVHPGATVSGGLDVAQGDAAGVSVDSGSNNVMASNTLNNAGTITNANGTGGTGVSNAVGMLAVQNTGTITGNVLLDGRGGSGTINGQPGSTLQSSLVRLGGGTFTNAGRFDVRGGSSSTALLDGNYHALPGGVLHVGADFGRSTADHLTITGNAQLDSGSAVRVDVGSYVKGAVPVLTVNGTLSGNGLVATASNPSYLFGLQTTQSGKTLSVQTVSNLRGASQGLTDNQRSVAQVIDQAWQRGDGRFNTGTAALATVGSDGSYRASLTSLAASSAGGVVAARQAASERFSNNLVDCDPYGGPGTILTERSCVWVRSTGGWTRLSGDADQGYKQSNATVQIGGQREVAPGWFVGASAGYETSWLTGTADGAKVSGQSALFGLMAKYQIGPWEFAAVADGSYGSYQSQRVVQVGSTAGTANGSPTVGSGGLLLRASYQVKLGDWYAKPSLTVSGLYRSVGAYAESGTSPFALTVRSSSDLVGTAEPALEVGRGGTVPGLGTLRGFVKLGAVAYVGNSWSGHAAFALSPSDTFKVTARQPDAAAHLQAGVDLFTVHGIDTKLTYDAQLAPGYTSQAILARLAVTF